MSKLLAPTESELMVSVSLLIILVLPTCVTVGVTHTAPLPPPLHRLSARLLYRVPITRPIWLAGLGA